MSVVSGRWALGDTPDGRTASRRLRWALAVWAALAAGCDDGSDASADAGLDGAPSADGGAVDARVSRDGGTDDAGAPPALETVSGELTYVAYEGGGGHIYSVFADGSLRQRVSLVAAPWATHAVGPDPRYVAALRYADYDADGHADLDSTAEVWIIDLRERRSYPLSPPGCDAAGGGVGWPNDSLVMFALSCGGEPAAAYVYPFDNEDRDPGFLLPVTAHATPVRDVFPVVNTPLFAYTLDEERCDGGRCVQKPAVWVSDSEEMRPCRLTDGDLDVVDGAPRLGDHSPAFSSDLSQVVFSRNVPGKPNGPGGHFDAFGVGVDQRSVFDRNRDPAEPCAIDGSLRSVTEEIIDDRFVSVDGGDVLGHERYPQPAAGSRAPNGALLFTGQTYTPAGATSAIWVVELGGGRRAVTSPTGWADHGRWIVDDYMLTGER